MGPAQRVLPCTRGDSGVPGRLGGSLPGDCLRRRQGPLLRVAVGKRGTARTGPRAPSLSFLLVKHPLQRWKRCSRKNTCVLPTDASWYSHSQQTCAARLACAQLWGYEDRKGPCEPVPEPSTGRTISRGWRRAPVPRAPQAWRGVPAAGPWALCLHSILCPWEHRRLHARPGAHSSVVGWVAAGQSQKLLRMLVLEVLWSLHEFYGRIK